MHINQIPVTDGHMPTQVTLAAPGQPGVLIVPPERGLGPGCEPLTQRFARAGMTAMTPDLLWRTTSASPRQILDDLTHARHWLAARGVGPVIALGIGFGGRFAILSASRGTVDAAITWHSPGLTQLTRLAGRLRGTISMHFGETDPGCPPDDIDLLRRAFGKTSVCVHPTVGQDFTQKGLLGYNPIASNAVFADILRSLRTLTDAAAECYHTMRA